MEIKRLPITIDLKSSLERIRKMDATATIVYVRRNTLDGIEDVPQIVIPPIKKIGKQ